MRKANVNWVRVFVAIWITALAATEDSKAGFQIHFDETSKKYSIKEDGKPIDLLKLRNSKKVLTLDKLHFRNEFLLKEVRGDLEPKPIIRSMPLPEIKILKEVLSADCSTRVIKLPISIGSPEGIKDRIIGHLTQSGFVKIYS